MWFDTQMLFTEILIIYLMTTHRVGLGPHSFQGESYKDPIFVHERHLATVMRKMQPVKQPSRYASVLLWSVCSYFRILIDHTDQLMYNFDIYLHFRGKYCKIKGLYVALQRNLAQYLNLATHCRTLTGIH